MKNLSKYIEEKLIINKDYKPFDYSDNTVVNYLLQNKDDILETPDSGAWCFKFEPGEKVFNDILKILNDNIFINKNKIDSNEYITQLNNNALCTYNTTYGNDINFVIQENDKGNDCLEIEISLINQSHNYPPYAKFILHKSSTQALRNFKTASSIYKINPRFFLGLSDFIVENNKNFYKGGTPYGYDYDKKDIIQKYKL